MQNRLSLILVFLLIVITQISYSQERYQLTGVVKDAQDSTGIPGASVVMVNQSDSLQKYNAITDVSGSFLVSSLLPGNYKLEISFISYLNHREELSISNQNISLSSIFLSQNVKQLKEISITGQAIPVQINGDTVQFNSDAFKVHSNATAEDLLKKMPGVTTDGNTVKVNGEEVKKILVDGKPFFSDDPTATLRNLPADIIGNVQVFDQQSDQSQFTGFKDGNEERTINLKTKTGMNVGTFGKAYAGYGTDDKYNSGFTYNMFNGSRRISLIGMSNNINQQNFSISDIMSVMSNSDNPRMGSPGGEGSSDFFTSQQNGMTNTNAIGLNYNDTWGRKIKVSGNYFFNYTDNKSNSSILRDYYTDNNLQYNQTSTGNTKNLNHKFNLKLEYFIDSLNKITISPRLIYQSNKSTTDLLGGTRIGENALTQINNSTLNKINAYNFSNDILFQHKFLKKGRTFSLNLNTQVNNSDNDGTYHSSTIYSDSASVSEIIDQQYVTEGTNKTLKANLSYTEPVSKKGQLMIHYKPSYSTNESEKKVSDLDVTREYSYVNTELSNTFENNYIIQRGGISYNQNTSIGLFSIGSDVQQAQLNGNQTYPETLETEKTFFNVLPNASYNYKSAKNFNLSLSYSASTKSPTVSQLQNSIDNSNALFVKSGNPYLGQAYENNFTFRTMKRLAEKEKHFVFFVRAAQTNDYIGNSTTLLSADTIIQNIVVNSGSQFTKPVNLDNYYSVNSFGAFGFPVKSIKSNLNFHVGYGLTNTPALINDQLNYALNNSFRGGFYLSSNISQNLDFTLGYNSNYGIVSNSSQNQSNSTYLSHIFTIKATYTLLDRIVFNSDLNQYYYTGLSSGYNQSFSLLNASIGYKLLKDRSVELKLAAYDLLNQNTSINRTITETYTEDSQTQVLNRYFMINLTYTFKKFKGSSTGPDQMKLPKGLPPPDSMPFSPPGR